MSFTELPFQTFSGSAAGRKPLLRPSPRHQQMRHLSALFGTFSLVSAYAGLVSVTVSQWAILSLAGKHRGIEAWIGLNQVYEILWLYSRSIYSLRLDLRYLRTLLNCIMLYHALYIAYLMLSSLPDQIHFIRSYFHWYCWEASSRAWHSPCQCCPARRGHRTCSWGYKSGGQIHSNVVFCMKCCSHITMAVLAEILLHLHSFEGLGWLVSWCILHHSAHVLCSLGYLAVYFFMFDLSLKLCKHFNSPRHLLQNPFWQPSQRSDWTDCR